MTRAVHLDVMADQSTETFLRCLKRFSARRGLPAKFISDNRKTFKAAAKYLKTVFKDAYGTVKEYLSGLGTDWMFNVERTPYAWWGGVIERMVRSTKRCLWKLIGRAQYSLDELVTTLAEIEAVINSRPLTYYVSAGDVEEPQDQNPTSDKDKIEEEPGDVPRVPVPTLPDKEAELDARKPTRHSRCVAAQRADASQKVCMFGLEDD